MTKLLAICMLGCSALIPASGLSAQRTVHGIAFDSLRAMRPIAGATIRLLATGATVLTDASGRFTVFDAPVGAFELGYWSEWLDTLGLTAIRVQVPAERPEQGASSVYVATPSLSTYQRARCGTALDSGVAILVGEVRDVSGRTFERVEVRASWLETRVANGRVSHDVITVVDSTSASGRFTLCAVPMAIQVRVVAVGAERASDPFTVDVTSAIVARNIIVSGDGEYMRVVGRVLGDSGTAVRGATVTLSSDSTIRTRTTDGGGFVLDRVPRRSTELAVLALGFSPATVQLGPNDSLVTVEDVRLERLALDLEAVRVEATPLERERRGFEERRRGGAGTFVTDSMLARLAVVTVHAVANFSTRLVARGSGGIITLKLRNAYGYCSPRFFIDGVDSGRLDRELARDQVELLRRAKRIEIYSAAQAPPRFNDNDGCGAIVVWTR